MNWKATARRLLLDVAGLEVRRAGRRRKRRRGVQPGDRLLEAPAFVLCTVRSGSTLLRVLLDSHSQVHAPQELHLRDVGATIGSAYAETALAEIALDETRLQYLLWDRLLQRELAQSGKRLLVNKTPSDVFIADRILECWPDARFIFLLRHPLAIARSRQQARPQDAPVKNLRFVQRYGEALEAARRRHAGLTVRYEDLAADPAAVMRRVCGFLGVDWEPQMLDYGRFDHGRYRAGLGDWSSNIRSGKVQPAPPPPDPAEVPAELRGLAVAWGYLSPELQTVAEPPVGLGGHA